MSSTPQKNTKSGGSYFFKKRAAKVLWFLSDILSDLFILTSTLFIVLAMESILIIKVNVSGSPKSSDDESVDDGHSDAGDN